MAPWSITILLLVSRYLHIVATALLVGGTFFYEMVVPIAIDELHEEQKLLIFARARWMFRGIVWGSAVVILASGAVSTWDHWQQYRHDQYFVTPVAMHKGMSQSQISAEKESPALSRPRWWWVGHMALGFISVVIALGLTIGRVPPSRPIRWMRLNLVIFLLVIFLAAVARLARLQAAMRAEPPANPQSTG